MVLEESGMSYQVFEMTTDDYNEVYALWEVSEGIKLNKTIDTKETISRLLKQNPHLSFVVRNETGKLVGAVLCSSDGRHGYLNHLVVDKDHRRKGIGRSLVGRCLYALMRIGIQKVNLFILVDNKDAIAFWENVEWAERVDLVMMTPREL
jgi:ribosomal protein S18 acetylase RimI-like enzyme